MVIEAMQLKQDNRDEVCKFMGEHYVDEVGLYIPTAEGLDLVKYNDWIIKDVEGIHLCKPDIFEKTYEEV